MKKNLSTILLVLVLLVGVAIMLYPTASDYWNSFHQSRAIASYAESVSHISAEDYERMWLEAGAYNQKLLEKANPFVVSEEDWAEYEPLLNVAGDGIMGYIEITKICPSTTAPTRPCSRSRWGISRAAPSRWGGRPPTASSRATGACPARSCSRTWTTWWRGTPSCSAFSTRR